MRFGAVFALLTILALRVGPSAAQTVLSPPTLPVPVNAVGRFYVGEDAVCTAWAAGSVLKTYRNFYRGPGAVWETRIVTAGHCVTLGFTRTPRFFWNQPAQDVQYGNMVVQMPAVRVQAEVIAYSWSDSGGHDLAVLLVRSLWPVAALIPDFTHRPVAGDKLLLVGYGNGAFLPRVGVYEGREGETDALLVSGITSPGTSGGPVLIPGTNRVVGVNVRRNIRPEDARREPGWCFIAACVPASPWIAAPMWPLQNILRWP